MRRSTALALASIACFCIAGIVNADDSNNHSPLSIGKIDECTQDGTGLTKFFYNNEATYTISVAVGRYTNRMMPGLFDRGQPTVFLPGYHIAHTVTFPCDGSSSNILQWIVEVNGVTLRAIATCSSVTCDRLNAKTPARPQQKWKHLGPKRGIPVLSNSAAFPDPQSFIEFGGSKPGVLHVVGAAGTWCGASKKSGACRPVFQQTLVSTQHEARATPAPLCLYNEKHPTNDALVYRVCVTETLFRDPNPLAPTYWGYGVDTAYPTPNERVWRMNVEVSSESGKAPWTEVYSTSSTPTSTLVDEHARCLTITSAGVVLICVHNAHDTSQSGILRSPTGLPGSFVFVPVSALPGGTFVSSIVQKPGSPNIVRAFGYNLGAPSHVELGWSSSNGGASFSTTPILTPKSSPLLSNNTLINSIKVATSVTPSHVNHLCMIIQRLDVPGGVPSDALAGGCSVDNLASYQLYQTNGGTMNLLGPNPDSTYAGSGRPALIHDLNDAHLPIAINSDGDVLVGDRHLFVSKDRLKTAIQATLNGVSKQRKIYEIRITADDAKPFSCGPNYSNVNARRRRTLLATDGGILEGYRGVNFSPYYRLDEMMALHDHPMGIVYRQRVHPREPNTVVFLTGSGAYESLTNGSNPRRIFGVGTASGDLSMVMDIGFSYQNSSVAYIAASIPDIGSEIAPYSRRMTVYMSTDRYVNWTPTCFDFTFSLATRYSKQAHVIAVDPTDDSTITVATSTGIMRITNYGQTCVRRVPSALAVNNMKLKPGSPNTAYATSAMHFLRTTNAWTTSSSPRAPPVTILGSPMLVRSPSYSVDLSGPIYTYRSQVNPVHAIPTIPNAQVVVGNFDGTPLTPGAFVGKVAFIPYEPSPAQDLGIGYPVQFFEIPPIPSTVVLNAASAGALAVIIARDGLGGNPSNIDMQNVTSIYAILVDAGASPSHDPNFAFAIQLEQFLATNTLNVKIEPGVQTPNSPLSSENGYAMAVSGLEVSPLDPSLVWYMGDTDVSFQTALHVSTDSTTTWTVLLDDTKTVDANFLSIARGLAQGQLAEPVSNYPMAIAANPLDAYDLMVGRGTMFRLRVKLPLAYGNFDIEWVHRAPANLETQTIAGHVTSFEWKKNGDQLYFSTWGGAYVTSGNLFSSGIRPLQADFKTGAYMENGYFNKIAVSQRKKGLVAVVRDFTQAGCLVRQPDGVWHRIDIGDVRYSSYVAFDYSNETNIYHSNTGGGIGIWRSTFSPDRALRTTKRLGIAGTIGSVDYVPIIQHPTIPTTVYEVRRVVNPPDFTFPLGLYSSVAQGDAPWALVGMVQPLGGYVPGPLINSKANPNVMHCLVLPYTLTSILPRYAQDARGWLAKTTVGGAGNWTINEITFASDPYSLGAAASICGSDVDPDLVVGVWSGNNRPYKVAYTRDGGATPWTDITENLPANTLAFTCFVDDTYAHTGVRIIIGTGEGGVFDYKFGQPGGWQRLGSNLPNGMTVTSIAQHKKSCTLYISTRGGGAYTLEELDRDDCNHGDDDDNDNDNDDDNDDDDNWGGNQARDVVDFSESHAVEARSAPEGAQQTNDYRFGTYNWWARNQELAHVEDDAPKEFQQPSMSRVAAA